MKAKYITAFVIIIVLFISSFVFLSQENDIVPSNNASNNTAADQEPQEIEPTATSTSVATPTPLITASPNPSNPSQNTYRTYINVGNLQLENQFFGPVGASETVNKDVWRRVAENAWRYFDPDRGVDSLTGLPHALVGFPYFTDWDLGSYLQAIIDAQRIGILAIDGDWGARDRIEKVMAFLENRELNMYGTAYWWYEAGTGKMWSEAGGQNEINVADTGRLLVALKNLRKYDNTFIERVNNLVYQRMNNYSLMWSNITMVVDRANTYDYFVSKGFASFWPENFSYVPKTILRKMSTGPKIETHGITLPVAGIACEPLFLSIFDFANHEEGLFNLTKQVYLAHEARYNSTGKYVAFSEGNSGYGNFVYEWVVFDDIPEGRTWVIQDSLKQDFNINPVIFSKVAFSFLSLYRTDFAKKMVVFIENATQQPTGPYYDGIDDADPANIFVITAVGSNTNSLILSSARFAYLRSS